MSFTAPPPALCTDNGAMVAWAGIERLRAGLRDGLDAPARARWPLDAEGAAWSAVAVLGAGAWGTALAVHAARLGHEVELWGRGAEHAAALRERRENARYLPGVALPSSIRIAERLAPTAPAVLLATPAQAAREVCAALADSAAADADIAVCCKGIERSSGALAGAVVGECLPRARVAVLTGPSFADEVAAGLPTAVTLACADEAAGRRLAALIGAPSFRPYRTDDVVGRRWAGRRRTSSPSLAASRWGAVSARTRGRR